MLAARLQSLCDAKVFEKKIYQTGPNRFEYRLTECGADLFPSIMAMTAWGDEHLFDGAPPIELTHEVCGEVCSPQVVCGECREPLRAHDVSYRYAAAYEDAVVAET